MIVYYLFWIGMYNVLGAILLMFLNSEKVSDALLRKYTEIIHETYTHGSFGRLWLWWAASANLFLGLTMVLATRWQEAAQKEVVLLAIITYFIMYLVMLIGGKSPKYGRGIYITHFLWLAQMGWGIWVII